jgi:hypothetical protein
LRGFSPTFLFEKRKVAKENRLAVGREFPPAKTPFIVKFLFRFLFLFQRKRKKQKPQRTGNK